MANKTETVRVRMEPKVKKEAEKIFAALGISTSDAVTMFYKQVKFSRGLPFEGKLPNASLQKTIHDVEVGKDIKRYASLDALKAQFEAKH